MKDETQRKLFARVEELESARVAKPERKIAQITDVEDLLIALCDDGTLWKLYAESEWEKLPPIPQGDAP